MFAANMHYIYIYIYIYLYIYIKMDAAASRTRCSERAVPRSRLGQFGAAGQNHVVVAQSGFLGAG